MKKQVEFIPFDEIDNSIDDLFTRVKPFVEKLLKNLSVYGILPKDPNLNNVSIKPCGSAPNFTIITEVVCDGKVVCPYFVISKSEDSLIYGIFHGHVSNSMTVKEFNTEFTNLIKIIKK